MHLAITVCNFSLWNAMAVLHSDCFECHQNGEGFMEATTRASIYLSARLFYFPLYITNVYK